MTFKPRPVSKNSITTICSKYCSTSSQEYYFWPTFLPQNHKNNNVAIHTKACPNAIPFTTASSRVYLGAFRKFHFPNQSSTTGVKSNTFEFPQPFGMLFASELVPFEFGQQCPAGSYRW